jgi:hypothetical protein
VAWLRDNLRPALECFGDERIGALTVQQVATWRASVPEGKRYRSHRALRQVLQAAVRWLLGWTSCERQRRPAARYRVEAKCGRRVCG